MDSATSAGRGVGPTVRTSLPSRARLLVLGVALVLVAAALPASAATAPRGQVPPAATSPAAWGPRTVPVRAALAGSDEIAALERALRRVEAQLANARTRVTTLTARRDRAAADRRAAGTSSAWVKAELASARTELARATTAWKRIDKVQAGHQARVKAARAGFAKSEAAMTASQRKLDALIATEAKAATRADRAVAKAKEARAGSAAWRRTFTSWQMAAVAARAAHSRTVLAEDVAADGFVANQEAEAELLQAEEALEVSDRELAAAVAARTGAARGVEDLTSARARARVELTARTKALKAVEASLATATKSVKQLTSELSRLSNRLSDAESRLTRSSIGPGLPGATGAVAS
ncbi:MAG: hypothetical protein MUF09_04665 [Candidatus Nanopelagicales bacterium]|nr:hypothetical protein [Candidatus Nanopelagicales bacterium]